ncbi:MAG: hypothetical protein ACJAU4_000441 [Glaciecola sp.]|jgi:hypothetical protein
MYWLSQQRVSTPSTFPLILFTKEICEKGKKRQKFTALKK